LQLHQPIGRLGKNRKLRQVAAHHGDFIATMEARASVTIFVDLVRDVLTLRYGKSLGSEEIGLAGK
jgi:hypothetical protein